MAKSATEQQATKLSAVLVEHHVLFTGAPAEDVEWAIQNPSEAIFIFTTALKSRIKEVTKKVVKKVLNPFITIEIGGTTREKLIADIKANKNGSDVADEVSDYAQSMMANQAFTISKEKGTAALVALSIAELGFTEDPQTIDFMTTEFCTRWSTENLDGYVIELCHTEDGPQLRKQWKEQPKNSLVYMAMKCISVPGGGPHMFTVERDFGVRRWVYGSWAGPGHRWRLGDRFVFRLRKITKR
jgi:hypothetical protein